MFHPQIEGNRILSTSSQIAILIGHSTAHMFQHAIGSLHKSKYSKHNSFLNNYLINYEAQDYNLGVHSDESNVNIQNILLIFYFDFEDLASI